MSSDDIYSNSGFSCSPLSSQMYSKCEHISKSCFGHPFKSGVRYLHRIYSYFVVLWLLCNRFDQDLRFPNSSEITKASSVTTQYPVHVKLEIFVVCQLISVIESIFYFIHILILLNVTKNGNGWVTKYKFNFT